MKVRVRLTILLSLLLLAFIAGTWGLHRMDSLEANSALGVQKQERTRLLESLLQLTGESLKTFATDYARWDDMVAFVASGDKAWAAINIDDSLPTFNAKAAWVFAADGRLVYGAVQPKDSRLQVPPFDFVALQPRLLREELVTFFLPSAEGLLEIRAAPIRPSDLALQHQPARGWFMVARPWNAALLKSLQDVLASDIKLLAPMAEPPGSAGSFDIDLRRELPGWDGHPVAVLHVHYSLTSIARLQAHNDDEMFLIAGFGFGGLVLLFVVLSLWIALPLHRIERSLEEKSAAPLGPLLRKPDEFGRLARLTENFFAGRVALEREVEERLRAEVALRRSTQLRTRLARDLHDSVIQSIYAAGLGLEAVRGSLRADPELADKRLQAAITSLNRTIAEVRSFITGLEPENEPQPQFSLALRSLVETLQGLHPLQIDMEISAPAALTLSAQEELHALQIARECVSNCLRHSQAARVGISLASQGAGTVLAVTDDGRGFDPTAVSGRGHGLANIAARAREMGARLEIDSAPGRGCRVSVHFAPAAA